jgi:uncharacterized protein
MQVEQHGLHHEFPEFKAKITYLKTQNPHFAKLFTEYDELDHRIRGMENVGSPLPDRDMEELKLHRVRLKDELYRTLSVQK